MPTPGCRMSRLRILHVGKFYPPHRGGIETHVRDLAVREAQADLVTVIASNQAHRSESAEIDGVSVTRLATLTTVASMPICPALPAAIRRCPADIVNIHTPNPAAAFAFLASGHTSKLVVTHHADIAGRKALRRLSDPFVVRLMQRASRIIVTSAGYLRSSEELAPFREKCHIIPLGIDISQHRPVNPKTIHELRQRFGNPLVLAVGRLVPYKGFDVLIRSMKQVNGKLLLIGSGPQAASLTELIEAEGMSDKIAMLGSVEELDPYLQAASVFVLPSITRAEAFGLVQLEAMASGLPIINTQLGSGVPEVSIHGETGLTVPPHDVDALQKSIQMLLNRKDLRIQFGQAARRRVCTEFTADLMAERTMALYKEILG